MLICCIFVFANAGYAAPAQNERFEKFVLGVLNYGIETIYSGKDNMPKAVKSELYTMEGKPIVLRPGETYLDYSFKVHKNKDTIFGIVDEMTHSVPVLVQTKNPQKTFEGGIKVGGKLSDAKKSGVLSENPQAVMGQSGRDWIESIWQSGEWRVSLKSSNDSIIDIQIMRVYQELRTNPQAFVYP